MNAQARRPSRPSVGDSPLTCLRGGKQTPASKPASQPASQPASAPASAPATQPVNAAATGPRLSKKTVIAPWPQTCGKYKWPVLWQLDKKTDKEGWIVQKLDLDYQVMTCGDTPRTLKNPLPEWFPYWEAWPVAANSNLTVWGDRGEVDDDTFEWGFNDKSKGYFKVTGQAEFYDGLTLPKTFVIRTDLPSRDLPMTRSAPSLAGGTGAIEHSAKATWDCCSKSRDDRNTKLELT